MKLNDILLELDVDSSWLVSIDYDEAQASILMKTKSGKSYIIYNIPANVFNRWIATSSKGMFFHNVIKDRYNIKIAPDNISISNTEDTAIKTKDGMSYIIYKLPKQLLNMWKNAKSKRDFFFQKIKNKFKINKLNDE